MYVVLETIKQHLRIRMLKQYSAGNTTPELGWGGVQGGGGGPYF